MGHAWPREKIAAGHVPNFDKIFSNSFGADVSAPFEILNFVVI